MKLKGLLVTCAGVVLALAISLLAPNQASAGNECQMQGRSQPVHTLTGLGGDTSARLNANAMLSMTPAMAPDAANALRAHVRSSLPASLQAKVLAVLDRNSQTPNAVLMQVDGQQSFFIVFAVEFDQPVSVPNVASGRLGLFIVDGDGWISMGVCNDAQTGVNVLGPYWTR